LNTSTSKRDQALTAQEVAARCRDDPEALFLCDVGIGDTDIDALCKGLKNAGQNLSTLDISNNQIADAGLQALVTAFAGGMCPKLTELYIGCNQFGEQGLTMLNSGLRVLRKGLTIHAEDMASQCPAQELGGPSTTKLQVDTTEQEARLGDVSSPASRKKKSPTAGDTGASLDDANAPQANIQPQKTTVEEAGLCTNTDFIESATFTSSKPGFVFKMGPRGLGYYRDPMASPGVSEPAKKVPPGYAAPAVPVASAPQGGSSTIVEGAEGQEVHVVVPLSGSGVKSAADLELDVSISEVRVSGPGGLSVTVLLPARVDPSTAQPSFSKKRQQLVVKLKACSE